MAYDSANFEVRREVSQTGISVTSSAAAAKFLLFQKAELKKVHVLVNTAGTNAAAGLDVYVGTTSVGEVTYGDGAEGTVVASALLNAEVPANGVVELRGKATSEANVSVVLETEVSPDSVKS